MFEKPVFNIHIKSSGWNVIAEVESVSVLMLALCFHLESAI